MGNILSIRPTQSPSGAVRGGDFGQVDQSGFLRGIGDVVNEGMRQEAVIAGEAKTEAKRMEAERRAELKQLESDEARVSVLRAVSDAQIHFTERLNEAKMGDGVGATESLLKQIDTWQQGTKQTIPPLGQVLFEQQALQLKGQIHGNAFAFEQVARQKKLATDFDASLDSAGRSVWADPSTFTDLLARHRATANTMAVSAELKTKLVELARDKLSFEAASGMTERDPNGVLTKLGFPPGKWQPGMPLPDTAKTADTVKNDPIFSNLPPEKLQGILHRALSLSAAQDATTKRLTDQALKEAEKATKDLQGFALTGALASPEYIAEVKRYTQGTPFEGAANALLNQSVQGAAFGAQTIARQEQSIQKLEAQAATAGSNPEMQTLLKTARTITETQKREYAENPWQAGTRFARLPAVPPEKIMSAEQVPQIVQKRLNMMGAVETVANMAVSPLQPSEAIDWANKLAAAPVPARAEILAATGAQLSAPRINALAEQLDKGNKPLALMLKLGADQTTAGRTVSELIGRGDEALRDKRVKKDDTALSGWRSEISTIVRSVVGGKMADDAIDAAYYVRAAMDADGTAVPGFRLDASAHQAVKLVIGEVVTRGGEKTLLPRGIPEADFEKKLDAYTPAKLREIAPSGLVYIRGKEIRVEQLSGGLSAMGLKRDGSGRYIPSRNGALVTLDAAGTQPLALEVQ